MKIVDITIRPDNEKRDGISPINTLSVNSLELADWIRELQDNPNFDKIEGRFKVYRKGAKTVYLDLEF